MILITSIMVVFASVSFADSEVSIFNLPRAIERCIKSAPLQYKLSGRINPFYLRADLDGDGKIDHAVLMTNEKGQSVIVVCRAARAGTPEIVDVAAVPLGEREFDAWTVFPRARVQRGVEAGPPPILRGDALYVEWSESASGLVYWDGRRFRWYQQGD